MFPEPPTTSANYLRHGPATVRMMCRPSSGLRECFAAARPLRNALKLIGTADITLNMSGNDVALVTLVPR